MNKPSLEVAEFYITNVCNFNCTGCNRFNNYAFTGHQRWADYADVYAQWAEKLDLSRWTILGGEPFSNPDILSWVEGISNLWPNKHGSLVTNGSYLVNDKGSLYDILKRKPNIVLDIGLHNENRKKPMIETVKNWLQGEIKSIRSPERVSDLPGFQESWPDSWARLKLPHWPDCPTIEDMWNLPEEIQQECIEIHNISPEIIAEQRLEWVFVDANGVTVKIHDEDYFHHGALVTTKTGITVHTSNREQAHKICHSSDCHHFMNGLLYKCGQVSLFPEFDRQFGLELDQRQRDLMNQYQPCSVNGDIKSFVSAIKNSIPQCEFCPENYKFEKIWSSTKKIKIKKLSN